MALIVDTGPLYASVDRRDAAHVACRNLVASAAEPIVIPAPVLPEVDYFIQDRLHPSVRLALLYDIRAGAYQVEELQSEDHDRIHEICSTYDDADIGFVDAAVLAVVERLNETRLVTLDRKHFSLLRPRHVESLTLLP